MTETKYLVGDGTATSGATPGSSANGGYSIATVGIGGASSEASWWNPFSWGDYSRGQTTLDWVLKLDVTGDPGEEAEITADWDCFAFPVLTAYPSGGYPSGNTAFSSASTALIITGTNEGGVFYSPIITFYDEQAVVWLGVGGEKHAGDDSFSLGIFETGGPPIEIYAAFIGNTYAYSNPSGSAAANFFFTSNLKLTPRTLDPSVVPEPATFSLLGLGALGVLFKKKRTV